MVIRKDFKNWYALSCPVESLRFDRRTLEFLDGDRDGHIRTREVETAIDFLEANGVGLSELDQPREEDAKKLEDVLLREGDLAKEKPSSGDLAAMTAWQREGEKPEIAILGEETADAEASLSAVENEIDKFFTPPDEMPLVTDEADRELPLKDRLNPKFAEAIGNFAEKCVEPLLGETSSLTRLEYKAVKAKFQPYRDWLKARPTMNADRAGRLIEEEKLLRYKLYLGEFLKNFVTMERLYAGSGEAIFQTGILRIDGREMSLCFHVESEAAHAALAKKSNCCVIYLKLTRKSENAERMICAVVTAGTVGSLYVGRNGEFYDRDGRDWAAVVTRVIESQVSLSEAFWFPWRKVGESIGEMVKKFLGDKQAFALSSVQKSLQGGAQAGGAMLASSVAAVGIGIGMVGAAFASMMAVISSMRPLELLLSLVAVVLAVSLPSVILTWFKLRKRDLGAILNASGWAVNREIRFSMAAARRWTKCAKRSSNWIWGVLGALAVMALVALSCLEHILKATA